jgi:hypothetical protein
MAISESQADRAIADFYNEFAGLSSLRIVHRPTQEHFYGTTGSVAALGYKIKGAFLPRQGLIHLALANFHNAGDLRKSLQHEGLGHFGTLTFTEAEKRNRLNAIILGRQSLSMTAVPAGRPFTIQANRLAHSPHVCPPSKHHFPTRLPWAGD